MMNEVVNMFWIQWYESGDCMKGVFTHTLEWMIVNGEVLVWILFVSWDESLVATSLFTRSFKCGL